MEVNDVITLVTTSTCTMLYRATEMDRQYRLHGENKSAIMEGHCHVCNQSDVKVKPLLCGRHYYCRTCQEFVSRLIKGDFTCTKCSESVNREDTAPLCTVDKLLAEQIRIKRGQNHAVTDVDRLVALQGVLAADDDDDDSDLEGGNTEWDHLLQSIYEEEEEEDEEEEEEEEAKSSLATGGTDSSLKADPGVSCYSALTPIPHKPSYIRLNLPGPNTGCVVDENTPSTSKQPLSNTVTELLNSPEYSVLPPYISSKADSRGSSPESDSSSRSSDDFETLVREKAKLKYPIAAKKPSSSSDSFVTDPEEIERGTSPSKVRCQKQPFGWFAKERTSALQKQDLSESELLVQEIGQIEGPDSDTQSDPDVFREISAFNDDGFWDI